MYYIISGQTKKVLSTSDIDLNYCSSVRTDEIMSSLTAKTQAPPHQTPQLHQPTLPPSLPPYTPHSTHTTMGNDGGSIPKRRELVKEAAKSLTAAQLKEAQNEQQEYGWTTDPLTRKQLARPVVSDAAGVLYNKDSIIEFLLKKDGDREKDEMKKVAGVKGTVEGGFAELGNFGDRVKGLKDVVEVKFEVAEGERELGGRGEKWVCPITGRELGPGAKACYIVPCGHAFAGSVVKEIKGGACLQVRLFQVP